MIHKNVLSLFSMSMFYHFVTLDSISNGNKTRCENTQKVVLAVGVPLGKELQKCWRTHLLFSSLFSPLNSRTRSYMGLGTVQEYVVTTGFLIFVPRAELGWSSTREKGWPAVCKSGPRICSFTVPLYFYPFCQCTFLLVFFPMVFCK